MFRLVVCTLAAAGLIASPAHASGEPDLTIRLPEGSSGTQVFVDAVEVPGRLLYRFDALIENEGGTLDLYRRPGGGVSQAVYTGDGEPEVAPRPDQAPQPGPGVQIEERSGSFDYAFEKTHEHFHLSSAARYELRPEGGAPLVSDKVGFCVFDSYGPAKWFGWTEAGGSTWCAFNNPGQDVVRMGLSRGGADRYSAQREFQWVDITGVDPGPAVLRGQANPLHCVLESDEANNTTDDARVIPGVRVRPAGFAVRAGEAPSLPLAGEVIAPEVPARRAGSCAGGFCYVRASAGPLAFTVTDPPEHGSLALAGAEATYTPAAGFTGEDSFSYTATDARGLTSRPAVVKLSTPPVTTAQSPAPAPAPSAALSSIRATQRGGRWRLELRSSAPALLSARLERGRLGVLHRRVASGHGEHDSSSGEQAGARRPVHGRGVPDHGGRLSRPRRGPHPRRLRVDDLG